MSEWQCSKWCSTCDTELSRSDVFDTHGVCPYCGAISGCSVTKNRKRSRRWMSEPHPNRLLAFFGFRVNGRWEYAAEKN